MEVDYYGGTTFNLQGARAIIAVPGATADSGQRKVLPTAGTGLGVWFTKALGLHFDYSYIDAGKASASVGSNSAQVQGYAMNFHSGLQLQYPAHRIRPFVNLGGGVFHQSLSSSLNLEGSPTNVKAASNLASLDYGGGVRIFLTRHWGLKPSLDGYNVFSRNGVGGRYWRASLGVFWQRGGEKH
jgi:hypothetical protein